MPQPLQVPPVPAKGEVDTFKALGHPLRLRIREALGDGRGSPKQLSDLLGDPLGNTSYHVKRLADLGALKLVESVPRRGALEHVYELTPLGRAALELVRTARAPR